MSWLSLALIYFACDGGGDTHHDTSHAEESEAPEPTAHVQPLGTVEGVRYRVSFEAPQTHMFSVEATAKVSSGSQDMTWMMATWTPGSYLIREYARHVEGLEAVDEQGRPLSVEKVTKNRWTVDVQDVSEVTLRYQVYAREMTVRTNWVDDQFAMLNGAPTFITPEASVDGPYRVELNLPQTWSSSVTGLDAAADGTPHQYLASDFDELVDSPIVAGNPVIHRFELGGASHELVNVGGDGVWDQDKSLEGVKRVVEEQIAFWGSVPYERYVFLNVIAETGGGLEHLDSTLMLTYRDRTERDEDYAKWLGLVSHEFFHTWNVKRLRPVALGPFDYEAERYTPSLWIAEGITSYYDDLLLVRAGLLDPEEHLDRLSKSISRLQASPGRFVQPLTQSSHDAWIKFYRGDENSVNTSVSYYRKGSIVGWLLDTEIRRASQGRASLDDVMREMYQRYSGDEGYTERQFREVVSAVAGQDLGNWLARHVDQPGELDYAPALDWWGLRFREGASDESPEGWMGLDTAGIVTTVRRGTPAWQAGINVGDEILAVDGFRVSSSLSDVLSRKAPGDEVEVMLARRGRLRTIRVRLEAEPRADWTLDVDPWSGTKFELRRERWWGLR